MAQIDRIELLIHPDFLLMNTLGKGDPFIHHAAEEGLRRKWDDMVVSVTKNPNSRLVYMTWLTQRELQAATEAESDNPWRNMDYERIEEYKLMLGNRLIIAPLFPRYTTAIRDQILRGDNLTPSTELYMQGEWTNACVRREGNELSNLLGIEQSRRIIVPDNSRSSWEGKFLLEWHRELGPVK